MKAHEFLAEADSTKSYEIKRGDTLSDLARTNGTTVDAIMDLNQGNKAIRDRDTIYAGNTIQIPKTSSDQPDPGGQGKRKQADVAKPDDVAKIGNQEFTITPGPGAPGPNDDMGGENFGIDNPEWEFPTVELGFGDPGYTPIIGNRVEKRPNGNWYYPENPFPVRPDVARFAEKRLKDLDIVKSKDIGSQKFPMTRGPKVPDSGPDKKPNIKGPTRPGQVRPDGNDMSPIPDTPMTSGFGKRKAPRLSGDMGFGSDFHQGVDFPVPEGTSVYAPNNAVVLRASWGPKAGNYIELGDNQGNLTHKFFHLSKQLVKKGDVVSKGQEIAKSGNTGASTGAHLHWEKWMNGEPVDPANFVRLSKKSDS